MIYANKIKFPRNPISKIYREQKRRVADKWCLHKQGTHEEEILRADMEDEYPYWQKVEKCNLCNQEII